MRLNARVPEIPNPFPTPDSAPPISVSRFLEVSGLSAVTLWRMEKRGHIRTVRMAGRKYIMAAEMREYNRRLEAGEFAGKTQTPYKKRKTD
ncbi:MAG: hypothetical protein ABIP85_22685 [Chthoniobacteraceae bacterium]